MRLSIKAFIVSLNFSATAICLRAQSADEQLNALTEWRAAQVAHLDGLSEIVVIKLKSINQLSSLAPEAQAKIRHLLVESLVRSGRYEEALSSTKGDELPFWQGLSHAMQGRLSECHPLLLQCVNDPEHPAKEEALLTLASALKHLEGADRAGEFLADEINKPGNVNLTPRPRLALVELHLEQGKYQAALATAADFGDNLNPALSAYAQILEARAFIGLGKHGDAQGKLREIIDGQKDIPSPLINSASLLLADTSIAMSAPDDAVVILSGIIENVPSGGNILPAFDRLADAGFLETKGGKLLLNKWQTSPKRETSRPAAYFSAAASRKNPEVREENIRVLTELKNGTDPVAIRAHLLLAEILIEVKDKERALPVIREFKDLTDDESVLARIKFVEAKAMYEEGEFDSAAENFSRIEADDDNGAASYNSAVASLRAGDDKQFLAQIALLPEVSGQFSRGELQLERALYKCSRRDPDAINALSDFLREHPSHPRRAEAHLASAATSILYGPLNAESARENLKKALSLELTPQSLERAEYIAFWIEEIAGVDQKAIDYADRFIDRWPKSVNAAGVRMRQAEIQFRASDYLDAMRNFEKLSIDYPDSELSDKAIFFAGRSSMLTLTDEGAQRALTFWQKLADKKSKLAPLGRHHQAQIKMSQGLQEEALTILDAALVDEPGVKLRALLLMLKGRALYELGGKEPLRLEESIRIFAQALELVDLSTGIRNEILFRKAKAHEIHGQLDQTLSCLHEIMNNRSNENENESPGDFKWYYRAGFEAIRLKESNGGKQGIISAIAIADRLARTPGPRSNEAKKAGQRLRLEHFIWQED